MPKRPSTQAPPFPSPFPKGGRLTHPICVVEKLVQNEAFHEPKSPLILYT